MKTFGTINTYAPICPYCFYEHDFDINENGIYWCDHCGKNYEIEIEIIATYSTYKLKEN